MALFLSESGGTPPDLSPYATKAELADVENPSAVSTVNITAAGTVTVTITDSNKSFTYDIGTHAITWAFSGWAASGKIDGIELRLIIGASVGTQTFPANYTGEGGTGLTLTASKTNTIVVLTRDGGTTGELYKSRTH